MYDLMRVANEISSSARKGDIGCSCLNDHLILRDGDGDFYLDFFSLCHFED
jgi:hypothetical protein